jgi:RNA polymerase sigma factor (sigma-70 family)
MVNAAKGAVLQQLRRVVLACDTSGLADADLLHKFLARRDEAAFEALVRRHGPMVLGVCRRLLADTADAEDAFQATFLVFVQRAGSIRKPEQVGSWLYGVAYRTARKARALAARRRDRQRPLTDVAVTDPVPEVVWRELRPVFEEVLHGLPEKYRAPVVLCYLEGRTKRQAARALGWPEGTVASRLQRARELLRKRLSARGLTLPATAVAAALSQGTGPAAVPPSLVISTVQAAGLTMAGRVVASAASTGAALLAEGVLQSMFFAKCRIVAALLMLSGLISMGGMIWATYHAPADPEPAEERSEARDGPPQKESATSTKQAQLWRQLQGLEWCLVAVDTKKRTLNVREIVWRRVEFGNRALGGTFGGGSGLGSGQGLGGGTFGGFGGQAFSGGGNSSRSQGFGGGTFSGSQGFGGGGTFSSFSGFQGFGGGGTGNGRGFAYVPSVSLPSGNEVYLEGLGIATDATILIDGKRRKLTDLQPGMRLSLQLASDRPVVTRVHAVWSEPYYVIRAIDAAANTLTVDLVGRRGTAPEALANTFEDLAVARNVRVTLGGKKAALADLKPGMRVALALAVDQNQLVVRDIRADKK